MHHKQLINPVILMCSERSGSNLIARIFGSHPEFFAPSPAHLFRVFSSYDADQDLSDDLLRMFAAKIGIWKIDTWAKPDLLALFKGARTTDERIAALLNAEGVLRGKARVFLKENMVHGFIDRIESVADNPKYLRMIRDPRDMAASWVNAPTLRGGIVRAARRWCADLEGSLAVKTPDRPVVTLTYENLIRSPADTLHDTCAALGVPFAETMLSHVSEGIGVAEDAQRTTLWKNLSRGIMTDNSNKFEDQLDDDQIAYVEATCGPLMTRFGYSRSRANDAPSYGSYETFSALETAMEKQEPWTKPAYQNLPADERARLENWSSLRQELDDLHGAPSDKTHV